MKNVFMLQNIRKTIKAVNLYEAHQEVLRVPAFSKGSNASLRKEHQLNKLAVK